MMTLRTAKPCVTATAETEACSGKKMPKDPHRNHTGNYGVPLQWPALRQQHQRPGRDSHCYEKALKEGLCGEPDTRKESSSYNRHYVWNFRGNLLKQKATGIPSPKRTRSQTLYIRVECSFTNWMKIKIRQGIYNTSIGRFTQEDVIYNDGLNLYAYCSSNPVMYADSSGYAKKAENMWF